MHGQRIGYVRVSRFDQNPKRQLEHVPVDRLFTDKASGKDTRRPELERLLAFVREGDTVVVHSMDRLARNLDELRRIVQKLTQRGICIELVKENLTLSGEDSPMANLMLSVTAAIVLWNTVYLERATQALRETGKAIDAALLPYLSPLGWEHINLTGDYVWQQSWQVDDWQFRSLRLSSKP